MKCPECNGTGIVVYPMMSMNGDEYTGEWEQHECEACGGTGETEMTNEYFLRTATTEQLAEWLRGVYWHCHEIDCEHCNYPWRCMEKGDIVEWLKQPHTPIS